MVKEGNIKLKTKSKVDREMEITVSKKIDRKLRLKKDRLLFTYQPHNIRDT